MYKWDTPRIRDLLSSFDYEALTKWDDLPSSDWHGNPMARDNHGMS